MTPTTPDAPAASERRIAPRLQPALGTVCQFLHGPVDEPPTVGLVWNISETGVSMLLASKPERGAEVQAELSLESGGDFLPVTLRIVHVRPVPTGDFFIGAQFQSPLEQDDLQRFLAPPLPAVTPPKPPTIPPTA